MANLLFIQWGQVPSQDWYVTEHLLGKKWKKNLCGFSPQCNCWKRECIWWYEVPITLNSKIDYGYHETCPPPIF